MERSFGAQLGAQPGDETGWSEGQLGFLVFRTRTRIQAFRKRGWAAETRPLIRHFDEYGDRTFSLQLQVGGFGVLFLRLLWRPLNCGHVIMHSVVTGRGIQPDGRDNNSRPQLAKRSAVKIHASLFAMELVHAHISTLIFMQSFSEHVR